ncbi:MAG TPA: hypothetical protein VLT35_05085 [Methanocella sp.]|nr:hypothetical protein [Methanocella sp.]
MDEGVLRIQPKFAIALRAGLTTGVVLAIAELAFGIALYFLRPAMSDFIDSGGQDAVVMLPLITSWVAFLFLVLAVYFACGMIAAKGLSPLPLQSRDIAALGAIAGAVAELVRSVVAITVDFVLSYLWPLAGVRSADVLSTALTSAGIRLVCGLPAFVILAAAVAGFSAYLFSTIFFRPETPPK